MPYRRNRALVESSPPNLFASAFKEKFTLRSRFRRRRKNGTPPRLAQDCSPRHATNHPRRPTFLSSASARAHTRSRFSSDEHTHVRTYVTYVPDRDKTGSDTALTLVRCPPLPQLSAYRSILLFQLLHFCILPSCTPGLILSPFPLSFSLSLSSVRSLFLSFSLPFLELTHSCTLSSSWPGPALF